MPVLSIFRVLICLPFLGVENTYSFTNSPWAKFASFGKDTSYRLLNNPRVNWRKFLYSVVKRTLITLYARPEQSIGADTRSALVFDDTPIEKTGHAIEGVSRIWNHVKNKSVLGYQLLVMGLYDGTAFMPVDFLLHREKGKNEKKKFGLKPKHCKQQYNKKRNSREAGAKRKKELDITKINSTSKMIERAYIHGIKAHYVLTDSWFTCWEIVKVTLNAR